MSSIIMISYLLVFLVLVSFLTDTEGLNEPCSKNSDCETKGATCIENQCNCDKLSSYNSTQCLPYATEYGAFCSESAQCEWLGENSECRNTRCICKKSYRWYKGKCQAYVNKGEKCISDDDCYSGYDLLSLTCSSGVCKCGEGYYDRGHDCRKSSTRLNDDCALNIDCHGYLYEMVCTLGKCVKNNSTTQSFSIGKTIDVKEEYTPRIITEVSVLCKSDDDCRDVANSLCDISNGTCGCNAETHYLYQGNCVAGIKECTTSNDCTGSNMMCFKNTSCICKQGFFLKDKQCIAELGVKDSNVSYTEDGDCPIKPGKLVNSTCYCRDYWFSDDAARNCIKTMIQTTQTCLTNEWCYAMGPYAFCNSTTGQCACAEYASFNQSTYYCDKVEEPSSDICFSDNDCNLNEVCLDEKCGCLDNFKKNKDNICLPNVDASCLNTGCSHIGNSSCVGGICKCNDNYIGKEDGCLRMAEELYDACERQEQCARIEHTVCGVAEDDDDEEEEADEGDPVYKCVCGESYTAISKKCYLSKKYGDPCVTESDCTLVLNHSYQCRNSICQCSVGSKLKNGYCTSYGNKISLNYLLLLVILLPLSLS